MFEVLQGKMGGRLRLPTGVSQKQVADVVMSFFSLRFSMLSSVWAEKGRSSDDRLLSNIAALWESLEKNYLELITVGKELNKGDLIKSTLNALFNGFDKKIPMDVFGLGSANVSNSPILQWVAELELRLSYCPDEDETLYRREIKIRFVECDRVQIVDIDGARLSSTQLTTARADDYWLVNISPMLIAKDDLVQAMSERVRLKEEAVLALFELDAFFVLMSSMLRGFYVSINECMDVFDDENRRHIRFIDVVSKLNPQKTVGQMLKACIEYNSIWSFEPKG